MTRINCINFILLILTILSCNNAANKIAKTHNNCGLIVYAASGIRPAIDEVSMLFELNDSCSIVSNYASSGILARQIVNGADCDVFISANKQWIEFLIQEELVFENSIQVIAKNSLVAISPIDSKIEPPKFTADYILAPNSEIKIAIGNPNFVPVGKYTKMVFDTLSWYKNLASNLVMCKDVSSARHYVELGECNWGIVYYSEAIQSKKVKIIAKIPVELHETILFYSVILKSNNQSDSKKYINLLSSSIGQTILHKYGFQ